MHISICNSRKILFNDPSQNYTECEANVEIQKKSHKFNQEKGSCSPRIQDNFEGQSVARDKIRCVKQSQRLWKQHRVTSLKAH